MRAINDGISADTILLNQSEVKHQSRNFLLNQLIDIESIIDTTSDEIALESAFLAKENLVDQWIALDEEILALNSDYLDGVVFGLTNALQLNNSIETNSIWENNLKTVNQLSLEAQLYQQGVFDTDQVDQLLAIASQCPANGGLAVYQARSALPNCVYFSAVDQDGNCYPEEMYFSMQDVSQGSGGGMKNTLDNGQLSINPNPSSGRFTLSVKEGVSGKVTIYDALGQLIKKIDIELI